MLEQLRGRNLAHVGCTLGLLTGLVLGLVLATILVIVFSRVAAAADWAALLWLGMTFGLGALGYVLGGRYSARLWGPTAREE